MCALGRQSKMLKKMEIGEHSHEDEENDVRQKIETTLRRLQELKERVAELKRRCEELRQMESLRTEQEGMENTLRCDNCGSALDASQQVAVKDSEGVVRKHYHKECFQTLFK
jgi:predicted RNase H-like nuclease (RuvC/YqgF family)